MAAKLSSLANKVVFAFLGVFGEGFSSREYPARLLLKHVIIQKIMRINSHVPWAVHWTSTVIAVNRIKRGTRYPGLASGCYLDGRNGIVVGDNTWIGPHVHIISMNHETFDYTKYQVEEPIEIGCNCWLGANCTILPGVKLGNHVVVAAGAVVTKSYLVNDVVLGGVPARVIKKLESYGASNAELP